MRRPSWLPAIPRWLRPKVQRHLGLPPVEACLLNTPLPVPERADWQRALDRLCAASSTPVQVIGYSAIGMNSSVNFQTALLNGTLVQAPVERVSVPGGPGDERIDCLARAVVFLRHANRPIVIVVHPAGLFFGEPGMDLLAPTPEAARATLAALTTIKREQSIYRGRAVTLEPPVYPSETPSLRFLPTHAVPRHEVILPDAVLSSIERVVLGTRRHADTLRAANLSVRRGLLLHGPPGTGKTLMIRYLATVCPEHSLMIVTGDTAIQPKAAFKIARSLAPCLLVFEDVDLIATARENNTNPTALHGMLAETDHLSPRDEITLILTTNRPEVLEPALVARPGRIDQAVAFPLPDANHRRRLIELAGHNLDLSVVDLSRWADQTEGTSPAFLLELVRRAALYAADEITDPPLRLTDAHFQTALRELTLDGGDLTRRLLGY